MDSAARPAAAGAARWAALRDIFDHALSLAPQRRKPYLDEVCADDSSLRIEIEGLLNNASDGTFILDQPALAGLEQPAPAPPAAGLHRKGRFDLIRKLGEGGMGRVYEAWDTQNEARVALKTISHNNPNHLFLFKQEFRSSSQISHPNLIGLYELFAETDEWFFTMEYLPGRNFLEHYQPSDSLPARVSPEGETATQTMGTGAMDSASVLRQSHAVTDFPALRSGLRQLAEGVDALHQAGKLHRDIKSANVMVTDEGRVVLLDFGLMIDAEVESDAWLETRRAGTLTYMAPEQLEGLKLGPEADWYAVGVMLYQALTGQAPFTGTPKEILKAKKAASPVPPQAISPHAPEDLSQLCMALLSREPGQRPVAREILEALGESNVATRGPLSRSLWIGRESELAELRDAAAAARSGASVVMLVGGASGMGKSALVQRALKEIDGPDAMILSGRCGEQEFVPYKALDGLIDTLVHRLARLPPEQCAALLPAELPALARLFPAMKRLVALAHAAVPADPNTNSAEQRRRGVAALCELLRRVGLQWRLVLSIDDIQWGDVDSALMLDQILHAPDAPRLLLLGTYRAEEESSSEFLKILASPPEASVVSIRRLALGPLAADDAAGLVRMARQSDSGEQAEALLAQAGGNTYLLLELLTQAGTPQTGAALSLDEMLWARVQQLPETAQRLLEVTSLSVKPVRHEILLEAARLTGADRYALTALRNHRLVRTSQSGRPEIEPFHDRVREAVRSRLRPEVLQACHASLAEVWERKADADPEDLATHHHGAGNLPKAAGYYSQAAERSAQALAFDRAASQWRLALEHGTWEAPQERTLRRGMAEALVNGGRNADAAVEFETLLGGASASEHRELNRRSAYYYCLSGDMKAGKERLRQVLAAHRVSVPSSPKAALLPLLWTQAKAKFRGYGFRLRPAAEVPPALLARVDDFWAAGTGLASPELITGAYFMTRCVQASLAAGEPNRLIRALACEALLLSMKGQQGRKKGRELLAVCDQLRESVDQPQAIGMLHLARCLLAAGECRYLEAVSEGNQASQIFREQCQGANWELYTSRGVVLLFTQGLGDYVTVRRLAAEMMAEARANRDLKAMTAIASGIEPVLHMLDDNLEEAERGLEASMADADQGSTQYFQALQLRFSAYAYTDPAAGLRRFASLSGKVRLAMLMVHDHLRINMLYSLGCCALGAADRSDQPHGFAKQARGMAAKMLRIEDCPLSRAHSAVLLSGAAMIFGQRLDALNYARQAVQCYQSMNLDFFAAIAQRRVGLLIGGSGGQRMIEEGERLLVERTVRNPQRVGDVNMPGFRPRDPLS